MQAFFFAYLQLVIAAVRMILHIKLKDGDRDATTRAGMDVPDTLTVHRVLSGITWTVECTNRAEEFPTTACRGQQRDTLTISFLFLVCTFILIK